MKATTCRIAACLVGVLFMLSCSSTSERPASSADMPRSWQPTALGEITTERCIYYGEAENFKEKSGGDIDLKGGASKQKCLGNRWGTNPTDFANYNIDLEETSESTLLVIRAAFDAAKPQSYDVLIDGSTVRTATFDPTGGWGYTEKEWKCFSVPLGRIAKGPHTLTIKPVKDWQVVNIDCFALGKAG